MEDADILGTFRQSTIEQFPSADNLHAPATGSDEGQKCMGNLTGTLSDSLSLIESSEVIHLQQHQPVVCLRHPLLVSVLHLRCEADLR